MSKVKFINILDTAIYGGVGGYLSAILVPQITVPIVLTAIEVNNDYPISKWIQKRLGLATNAKNSKKVVTVAKSGENSYNQILPLRIGTFASGKNKGKECVTDMVEAPHFLGAGTTKSGKGVALTHMLLNLIELRHDSIDVTIIDTKRLDFKIFTQIKCVNDIIYDLSKAIDFLDGIMKEHERRIEILLENDYKNIQDYNNDPKNKDTQMKYNIIVMDEIADLVLNIKGDTKGNKIKAKLMYLVTRITQIGRATGNHAFLFTQNPKVEVINGLIKSNCTVRLGLRMSSHIESNVINVKDCHKIKKKNGLAYLVDPDISDNELIKMPYVSNIELKKRINRLVKKYGKD